MNKNSSRRSFLTKLTKGVIGASIIPSVVEAKERKHIMDEMLRSHSSYAANDKIQIALIGSGGMGVADVNTAITVPGIELVAVCDLYDGRLEEAKKRRFHQQNLLLMKD